MRATARKTPRDLWCHQCSAVRRRFKKERERRKKKCSYCNNCCYCSRMKRQGAHYERHYSVLDLLCSFRTASLHWISQVNTTKIEIIFASGLNITICKVSHILLIGLMPGCACFRKYPSSPVDIPKYPCPLYLTISAATSSLENTDPVSDSALVKLNQRPSPAHSPECPYRVEYATLTRIL